MTRTIALLALLLLTACNGDDTVTVRTGEMAGCAVTSRPTVAEVADCRAWQNEKRRGS